MTTMCIGQFALKTIGKQDFENPDGYEMTVPFKFKWRKNIGKVVCDCKEVVENYAPFYGFTWYHSNDCALMKYISSRPSLKNLWQVDTSTVIAQSE